MVSLSESMTELLKEILAFIFLISLPLIFVFEGNVCFLMAVRVTQSRAMNIFITYGFGIPICLTSVYYKKDVGFQNIYWSITL